MRKSISAWKTGKKIGSEAALVLLACASDVNGKAYLCLPDMVATS